MEQFMNIRQENAAPVSRKIIHVLVAASGFAALSWEVMWQIKSTLALGVSAWGTALTLAITMGGMSLGSFLMGQLLKNKTIARPVRLYGVIECVIGVAGLALGPLFQTVESIDTWAYIHRPGSAAMMHILSIVTVLGIPTICMGATLPVFGLVARQFRTSISVLYGLNTLGAACGCLLVAFLLIPLFGVSHAVWIISSVNIAVGIITQLLDGGDDLPGAPGTERRYESQPRITAGGTPAVAAAAYATIFVTGYATFLLEVAWFRSLTTAFHSTTVAFATMLAAVLIALGTGARLAPLLKEKKVQLGSLVTWAGILILLACPEMERIGVIINEYSILYPVLLILIWYIMTLDVIGAPARLIYAALVPAFHLVVSRFKTGGPGALAAGLVVAAILAALYYVPPPLLEWFTVTLPVVGAPMLLLGLALPWILDNHDSPRQWGRIYALNTFASIAGALCAGWIFLPTIGFARTAWLAGGIVTATGVLTSPPQKRKMWGLLGVAALLAGMFFESGLGRTRVLDWIAIGEFKPKKVLEYYEGPDATVSAVEYDSSKSGTEPPVQELIINGFLTSGGLQKGADYMVWMGHLPMLLHPDPQKALVICFGTGRTLNAVREENPKSVDIVEINQHVLNLAHNFVKANKNILADPRVHPVIMDGRAYMRRTNKTYDVITLEPMPPNFAGVNALYSKEFYELARKRLGPHGIIAQWVPFHLVAPHYTLSIAKTFQSVFPNSILWSDPYSHTGILLGSVDDKADLGASWPGFARTKITRELSEAEIRAAVTLNRRQLSSYAKNGEIISDDNQLLSYGRSVYSYINKGSENFNDENMELIKEITGPAKADTDKGKN
jgi:spermidine synthase